MMSERDLQRDRSRDASPWNWLLLVPIVIPVLTFLFNAVLSVVVCLLGVWLGHAITLAVNSTKGP